MVNLVLLAVIGLQKILQGLLGLIPFPDLSGIYGSVGYWLSYLNYAKYLFPTAGSWEAFTSSFLLFLGSAIIIYTIKIYLLGWEALPFIGKHIELLGAFRGNTGTAKREIPH